LLLFVDNSIILTENYYLVKARMHAKQRKAFFWFIFLVTVLSIPVLLLYGSGYRYNLKQNKLVQTGSIFISTTPNDAKIYLNDELVLSKNPKLVNNLTPNEYLVSIKKDGYYDWSKKILVESKQTSFANEIILVKKDSAAEKVYAADLPEKNLSDALTDEITSIVKQLALSDDIKVKNINNGWLVILDKKTQQLYLAKNTNSSLKIEKIAYSAKNFSVSKNDAKKILFYNDLEIWSYDLDKLEATLVTRQSEKVNEAIWLSDNYVIYAESGKINVIELDSREPRHNYNIASVNNSSELLLDKKENNLYYKVGEEYFKISLLD
jgi:hypothetical protein